MLLRKDSLLRLPEESLWRVHLYRKKELKIRRKPDTRVRLDVWFWRESPHHDPGGQILMGRTRQ